MAVVAVPVRFPMKLKAVMFPDTFWFPTTSRVSVGWVEPIPTLPLTYTKSCAPAKNPLSEWKGIVLRFPGATKSLTVILTVAIPVCCVNAAPTGSTLTPLPTKLNLLKLFAIPIWTLLSNTVKAPGINPLPTIFAAADQYRFPMLFS